MILLVVGTSNSGKSSLAEEIAVKTGDPVRIYLATMKVCNDEGIKRVERHRKQRKGKGFVTIESAYNVTDALTGLEKPMDTTVLLECVSNLVANELYENPERRGLVAHIEKRDEDDGGVSLAADEIDNRASSAADDIDNRASSAADDINSRLSLAADEIASQIQKLASMVHNLVLVTNEYDRDGEGYDDPTRLYVRLLCMVNDRIRGFCDRIYDLRKDSGVADLQKGQTE